MGKVKGILLDLNGVMYEDDGPMPGAIEGLKDLRKSGLPIRFITNTSTLCAESLSKKLAKMGFDITPEEIFGPTRATAHYLKSSGIQSVHLLLTEDARHDFADFTLSHSNPEAVVIGDIGDRWNYQVLNQAFEMLMFGAHLIALHTNRYWQSAGRLQMDAGGFVAALEYASDKKAMVIGKPSQTFFKAALEDMQIDPSGAIMVGDDIHSDVEGAIKSGIRGILMKTGKYRPELVADAKVNPDGVLENAGELKNS